MPIAALALAGAVRFGGLYVASLPAHADVWVDGRYVGRTPVFLDGLRDGSHAVTITKVGWRAVSIDPVVAGGTTVARTVRLDPVTVQGTGEIRIQGVSDTARVCIDQRPCGPYAPQYQAETGEHRLVVRDGAYKYVRSVAVYPGTATDVLLDVPPSPHLAVVAPVLDYLPASAASVRNGAIVLRWSGHVVKGRLGDSRFVLDGKTVDYNAPAGIVAGRLYLPLDLIETIAGGKVK